MRLSYQQIEEIAAVAIEDFNDFFFGNSEEVHKIGATPIDQFASQYLKLDVKIERLCTDESICGVTAYSDTILISEINGVKVPLPIKQNQVLLDIHFMQPGNIQKLCGKRRFTLAHECAHQFLYQMESDEGKAACRKMYTNKKAFTARELKTKEDWNEWQANALGAALILPKRDVCLVVDYMTRGRKLFSTFGNLDRLGNMVVNEVSDIFHASPSAVKIRLERLGYIEDITEEMVDLRREEAMA